MPFVKRSSLDEAEGSRATPAHGGCFLKREGRSHSIWINPKTGKTETIPRHTEIKEPLANKILRELDALEKPNEATANTPHFPFPPDRGAS